MQHDKLFKTKYTEVFYDDTATILLFILFIYLEDVGYCRIYFLYIYGKNKITNKFITYITQLSNHLIICSESML